MDKIMDNIMPSYSFSHQFYQHWTDTPSSVREAIVEELSDIIDLLHPNTALAEFRFTQPDLDAHIDSLYAEYYAYLAQQEQTPVAPVSPEAPTESPATPTIDMTATDTTATPESDAATDTPIAATTKDAEPATTALNQVDAAQTEHDAETQDPINSAFADALVQELGTHIDDYLSEQMAQISEDLKSWLRDEIGRQLRNMTPKES